VFAVGSPWYLALVLHDPDFAYQFFVDHHLTRFFGTKYHEEAFWFYIPVVLIACLPWSLLFPTFARFLWSSSPAVGSLRTRALGFLVLWSSWCLFFLSLSRCKVPTYMLPGLPPIAMGLGYLVECVLFREELVWQFRRARQLVPRLALILLAAIWLGLMVWAWFTGLISPAASMNGLLQPALCIAVILSLLVWGRRISSNVVWLLCPVLSLLLLIDIAGEMVPAWSIDHSPLAGFGRLGEELVGEDIGVVCLGGDWGSIPFQLQNDRAVANGTYCSPAELQALLDRHPRNFLIVKPDREPTVVAGMGTLGMTLSRYAESRRAIIFLAEPAVHKIARGTGFPATVP
jgi:hypothetical protein